jgi:hypothetical protein
MILYFFRHLLRMLFWRSLFQNSKSPLIPLFYPTHSGRISPILISDSENRSRMDGRSRSIPPTRRGTTISTTAGRQRTDDSRQVFKGLPNFELLRRSGGGKDDTLILVKWGAFLPPDTRSRGQESVPSSTGYASQHSRQSRHQPNTTYRKTALKPHPYDNTTMLPPTPKPKTTSKLLILCKSKFNLLVFLSFQPFLGSWTLP